MHQSDVALAADVNVDLIADQLGVEPETGDALPPIVQQRSGSGRVVLHPPGRVRGDLGSSSRFAAVGSHVRLDLVATRRELVHHPHRHRRQIRDPSTDGAPLEPECLGDLVAELRLIQIADGLGPAVQRPGIQRGPPVVRPVHQVRDHHMGVEMRVASPGGAVAKRRGDEPVTSNNLSATVATPAPRRLRLEHRECFTNRRIVRDTHGVADLGGAEAVEDRHRLRGVERGIKRCDGRR